jgi:hypothetical protein
MPIVVQIAQRLRFHPADFIVWRRLEQRIHQELRVLQKGQSGAAHKIHLRGVCVQRDQQALSLKQSQNKDTLIAKPKRFHVTITTTAKVRARIMHGLQETLSAKLLKWEQVDQNLPPPAQQQTIDRAGVFQSFEGRT